MIQHYRDNADTNVAYQHIAEALLAAIAEAESNDIPMRNLHAETKLRLVRMTDRELWELAKITSKENEPVYQVFQNYKQTIRRLIDTAYIWLEELSAFNKST